MAKVSAPERFRWTRLAARGTAERADRRAWLVVAVLTVAAAALRLPFLTHQSLWYDEVYTRAIVGEPTLAALWDHIKATESTPPLYYLLTWLLGGQSVATIRLVPALALTAAVPVSYATFWRPLGQREALVVAAIVVVTPELVSYGTDGRSYGLYVLTALLTVWAFLAVLDDGTRTRYALWALAVVLCLWTHYFAVFFMAAEVVALLALRRPAWKATAFWSAMIALLASPLIPLLAAQNNNRSGFIASVPLQIRVKQFVREFAMGPNVPHAALEAAGLVIACLAVGQGAVYAVRRGGERRALLWIAAFGVGAPLLLAVAGVEDRFDPRNVMPALPLAAALAAPALLRLRAIPLAAYLGLALVVSIWVAVDWRYEQLDYRTALATAKRIDATAPIITPTPLYEPVASIYLGRPPSATPPVAPRAWLLVEPKRAYGQRSLHPQPVPAGPAGFTPRREVLVHGFRLILYAASAPRPVVEPGSFVFPAR